MRFRYNPDSARHARPTTRQHLLDWIFNHTGVRLSTKPVCKGHCSHLDVVSCWQFERPGQVLLLGPRGGGKSFLTAIDTHLCSRFEDHHQTRILGGAKSQAQQVLAGFKEAVLGYQGLLSDKDQISRPGVEKIEYRNGSEVAILTASETSVRGPHVPTLRMDEVDEIEPVLREAAYGMVMDKRRGQGYRPMISQTSTWHNLGGPMGQLIEQSMAANEESPGSYPFFRFCIFDILEPCPEEMSGPNLEHCASCPLMPHCHEDKDEHGGIPKAKRASGHYTIASAIQKIRGVSLRTWLADYLCRGPRAEGIWFKEFQGDEGVSDTNVTVAAEFNPKLPVQFALDTGVHTGGVWFQIEHVWTGNDYDIFVNAFADYFAEDMIPEHHIGGRPASPGKPEVVGIKPTAERFCQGRMEERWTDPAGNSRNAIGTTTLGEWAKAGMTFKPWPALKVSSGLELLESLVRSADGTRRLRIHPRCRHLINAFQNYKRKQRAGQWVDEPEDPQHPFEDMMDPLRCGLVANFPAGRKPKPNYNRVPASRIF